MTSTVVTCGNLRLTLPHGAPLPALNVTPSGAVDLTFHSFSGVLTCETITSAEHHPEQNIPAVSSQQLSVLSPRSTTPLASQSVADSPEISVGNPVTDPVTIPSQPLPSAQVASQSLTSQPLAALRLPSHLIPSQSISSQPIPSQPLTSQQPNSQLHQSHTFPSLAPSLSHELLPFNAYPSAQACDSLTDSQLRPNETPQMPHFIGNQEGYLALTLQSSQESIPPITVSKDDKLHVEKRPASPKVDYRPSKQGKRVRFEKEPVILQSPSKSPVIAAKHPTPWKPVVVSDQSKTPYRRWGATLTRLQSSGSVILIGGESEAEGFIQQMSIFDAGKRLWIQEGNDTPDMPGTGRAWHTTTCIDLSLFVFGGEKEVDGVRTQTNDALIYDTTYYTWYPPALSGPAPIPRAGHCAALIPDSKNVVIYGGINGNKWLNDLHLLEELNTWSKVRLSAKSDRPSARSYASLTPAAGFLVLFGGNNKTRCFNDIHLLTPDLTWVEPVILGLSPKPRTGHCAVPSRCGKKVVIYGGWDDQGAQRLFYSDVWELRIQSPAACHWKCIFAGENASKAPGARAGASLCSATEEQDEMLLFGGWYQLSYFNDLHKLLLPSDKKSEFSV